MFLERQAALLHHHILFLIMFLGDFPTACSHSDGGSAASRGLNEALQKVTVHTLMETATGHGGFFVHEYIWSKGMATMAERQKRGCLGEQPDG